MECCRMGILEKVLPLVGLDFLFIYDLIPFSFWPLYFSNIPLSSSDHAEFERTVDVVVKKMDGSDACYEIRFRDVFVSRF